MPAGAAAWMPCSGVTVPLELTPALPPPSVCGLVEASAPMTAIDVSDEVRGRMLPRVLQQHGAFLGQLRRVRLVGGVRRDVLTCDPLGALSNRPKANISVRISERPC